MTLRAKPSSRSAALGVIPKGVRLMAYEPEASGMYHACGKAGNKWFRVGKDGTDINGWVVANCLKFPPPPLPR
ncbi:SH3 domain-containing protein [Streptomyces sp. BP-8]|uniref:SH3 domain-containing protein n=1 Tax=Streptomyces sirii TaxID=3127701 RepID=UPI00388EB8EF